MYKEIIYPGCDLKYNYYVDENGNVWSEFSCKILATFTDKDGYKRVVLMVKDDGKSKRRNFPIHRLVMVAFHPIENMDDLQVNHIDGNKANNSVTNLEWCTVQENITHAVITGLRDNKGEKNYFHRITNEDVRNIRKLYATGEYTYRALGKIFNLNEDHVSRIVRRKAWSNVI